MNTGAKSKADPEVGDAHGAEGATSRADRRSGLRRMNSRNRGGGGDDEEEVATGKTPKAKGKKKMENDARKEERRQAHEAMLQEQAKRRQEEDEERQKQKQQEKEEEEREAARLKEEREEAERKEQEEFEKWKHLFSVDAEGETSVEEEQENQGLLGEFVNYIQTQKVVQLDELADEFNLKTSEVVSRVKALESMDRITGVLDDRGKFIHTTLSEMDEVARFIKMRGRVSISELVEHSNTLIDLSAKPAPEVKDKQDGDATEPNAA